MLIAGATCSPASSDEPPAALGEPFDLSPGDEREIAEAGFALVFDGVEQDSRCPIDVDCIVAGSAAVVLSVKSSDGRSEPLTLEVPPRGSAATDFGDYRITVRALEPQAESTKTIEPESYVATCTVERPPP